MKVMNNRKIILMDKKNLKIIFNAEINKVTINRDSTSFVLKLNTTLKIQKLSNKIFFEDSFLRLATFLF